MNLNYLHTPAETIVDPPLDTKLQELPLEKLSWEDFEKLCLAIVQTDYSLNDCEIYGIKGQDQEGIDIFARQANGRYSSHQCKRYQKFDLSDINNAVEHFKTNDFFDKSDNLYLCTSCEWNKTQVQKRFEALKTELKKENITLVKWDKIQLSRLLKSKPQIVFDFFGLEWVRKFNGEPALQQISKTKKFDAKQIIAFRTQLYEFYSTIFNIQDPGLPIIELNSPYSLQDRFIIPDILANVKDENFEISKDVSAAHISIPNHDQYYYFDYWNSRPENELKQRGQDYYSDFLESDINIRIKVDDALISNNKNIIVGDPGAGKSTLLRYIALDILSSTPKLENISRKYGSTLPVWLPFAFVTKHLSLNDSLSISEILKLWFNSFGKVELFDVAKEALEDERLFLIIDGIDEWSSISSANQAINRIETLRSLYDCKVLYSSRPYGFRMLKDAFSNLNVLNLAGFSNTQQRDFVEKWYDKWVSLQKGNYDQSFSKTQSDNFIKELEHTGDLKQLAETPLLLSILVIQKMQDSVLPKSKLEALREITIYLIKKHPIKRVTAAGIVLDMTSDVDFKDVFCEIAIYIQKESNDGVILKSDAQKIIEQYLITYAEYDKAKAKTRSQELLEIGANNFGIIIEKSNEEISFGHKQFQEYLAAQYLYESDDDSACEFIKQYAANPAFHQVIISLFGLMQLKQVKKYNKHFDSLRNADREKFQEEYLKLVSYEISIVLDNSPSEILNSAFDSIVNDFVFETDPLYKEALLKRILEAVKNSRIKEKVFSFLAHYFPNQYKYTDDRVKALQHPCQLNEAQIEFIKISFINGSIETRFDASNALRKHIKNESVYCFVRELIFNCSNPDILAFAINSVITTDLTEQERDSLLDAVEIDAPIVQFYLYKHKVFTNRHSQADLEMILPIVNQLQYQLKKEAIRLLKGFGQDKILKEALINSLKKKDVFLENTIVIDSEIAWEVLFHSFNMDVDVINLVKSQFEKEEFPFLSTNRYEMIQSFVYYFKSVEELIPSVEVWLNKCMDNYKYIDPETAYASIFVHSDKLKTILLQNLPDTGIPHWNVMALLEGWADDPKIKEKLKEYFRTIASSKTAAAAHYISKVFEIEENDEAIKIAEGILFDKDITFRERVIPALIEIDKKYFETNVLQRLIDDLESFPKDVFGQYYFAIETIAQSFPSNSIVQSYILDRLEADSSLYSLAIQFFPEIIHGEEKLLSISLPLAKELRCLIIEHLNDFSFLPNRIEMVLKNFDAEAEEEVKGDMAICLFNHIRQTNADMIIQTCKPIVYSKGFDFEVMRNIAFTGFLISRQLNEYFSIEDSDSKHKSRRLDIFNENSYRRSYSELMVKSIIDNFEYLVSNTGKDFTPLLGNLKQSKEVEDVWGFFARHSVRSSPSYPYIKEFISNNFTTIKNRSIISFLNRTDPKSSYLKDILLRFINDPYKHNSILAGRLLGINFHNDSQVFDEVRNIDSIADSGRIIALCSGWPKEPVLKNMFDDLIKNQYPIDQYVGFHLKFLFRDIDNLVDFLNDVLCNAGDIKGYHKYFFIPMIERLKRDSDFCLAIKKLLLSSSSINEKISYYNLLAQGGMIDEDVNQWKKTITNFKNDFGYDIITNKTVRLKNVLHNYYY